METYFKRWIKQFPDLLKTLTKKELKLRSDLGGVSNKGVYVFYENSRPKYVGRSNHLKDRIQIHGRLSSGINQAPFAYQLANEVAKRYDLKITQKELSENLPFQWIFYDAKDRVSQMKIRYIKITAQKKQALFEIYASIELRTAYNDFSTH